MADYPYFPLFVDLSGKKLLVVGAGRIAYRRIRTLLRFAPRVAVVAVGALPELEALPGVELLKKPYAPSDLDGADLVFAATNDPAVNDRVYEDCKRLGIPVNVASDKGKSDFYFPGVAVKENTVIGVTASGKDHEEAKRLTEAVRELLEKE